MKEPYFVYNNSHYSNFSIWSVTDVTVNIIEQQYSIYSVNND